MYVGHVNSVDLLDSFSVGLGVWLICCLGLWFVAFFADGCLFCGFWFYWIAAAVVCCVGLLACIDCVAGVWFIVYCCCACIFAMVLCFWFCRWFLTLFLWIF